MVIIVARQPHQDMMQSHRERAQLYSVCFAGGDCKCQHMRFLMGWLSPNHAYYIMLESLVRALRPIICTHATGSLWNWISLCHEWRLNIEIIIATQDVQTVMSMTMSVIWPIWHVPRPNESHLYLQLGISPFQMVSAPRPAWWIINPRSTL